MNIPPVQVTFKLDATFHEELRQAAERHNVSANVYARELVLAALHSDTSEIAQIRQGLNAVEQLLRQVAAQAAAGSVAPPPAASPAAEELRSLRLDVATAVAAILAELRPADSADEIANWVKNNLTLSFGNQT